MKHVFDQNMSNDFNTIKVTMRCYEFKFWYVLDCFQVSCWRFHNYIDLICLGVLAVEFVVGRISPSQRLIRPNFVSHFSMHGSEIGCCAMQLDTYTSPFEHWKGDFCLPSLSKSNAFVWWCVDTSMHITACCGPEGAGAQTRRRLDAVWKKTWRNAGVIDNWGEICRSISWHVVEKGSGGGRYWMILAPFLGFGDFRGMTVYFLQWDQKNKVWNSLKCFCHFSQFLLLPGPNTFKHISAINMK